MSQPVNIDAKYLQPFESMALAFEMGDVPLLFFSGGADLSRFVEQTSAPLGGTVVYSSQPDFQAQVLASLRDPDHLFVVIDQVLAGKAYQLVHAYLAMRDVMGADASLLAQGFGAQPPAAEHRMALFVRQDTFAALGPTEQRQLAELCTRIAMA
jgi:hypothetical protein